MPIEIKGLVCPQCGGTDVEMLNEGRGLCRMCGAQFAVHKYSPETAVNPEEPEVNTYRILPEHSKADFLRKVWIELNEADAPAELFACDFGEIAEVEYNAVMQTADVEGSYTVSIGYDRQEQYLDTETYWEREGDRNVKKERTVTRYRTVTDWQAQSGTTGMRSADCVDNDLADSFDGSLFKKSFVACSHDSVMPVSASEAVEVTPEAYDMLRKYHELNLNVHLLLQLPGDHNKDLSLRLTKQDTVATTVYRAAEYRTSVCFDGKEYVRNAFPFGAMEIGGDEMENRNSLEANLRRIKAQEEPEIWKRMKLFSLLSIGLLALSILVNCFVHVTALVVICFVPAVGLFIFHRIKSRLVSAAVRREIENELQRFTEQYHSMRLEMLNRKLASLGLEPVTAVEGGA